MPKQWIPAEQKQAKTRSRHRIVPARRDAKGKEKAKDAKGNLHGDGT
jgi:hypothetical protein